MTTSSVLLAMRTTSGCGLQETGRPAPRPPGILCFRCRPETVVQGRFPRLPTGAGQGECTVIPPHLVGAPRSFLACAPRQATGHPGRGGPRRSVPTGGSPKRVGAEGRTPEGGGAGGDHAAPSAGGESPLGTLPGGQLSRMGYPGFGASLTASPAQRATPRRIIKPGDSALASSRCQCWPRPGYPLI